MRIFAQRRDENACSTSTYNRDLNVTPLALGTGIRIDRYLRIQSQICAPISGGRLHSYACYHKHSGDGLWLWPYLDYLGNTHVAVYLRRLWIQAIPLPSLK